MIPVVPSVAAQPLKRKASLPGSELGRNSALATDQPGRDINDVFDEIGFGSYQLRLLILVGTSFSCDTMEISLIVFLQGCVAAEWGLSSSTKSILTSAVFAGEIFGLFIFGALADKYGRRSSILFGWLMIVVFGFLSCISPNIYYLVVTRTLVGIGIGASQTVSYDLFAETIPTEYRNKIGYVSFFGCVGAEYVILTSYLLLGMYGWRWVAFACAAPMLLLSVFGYYYLSESSRWLVAEGRYAEAELLLTNANELNNPNKHYTKIILLQEERIEQKYFSVFFEGPILIRNILLWTAWILSYFSYYCILLIFINFYSTGQCSFDFGYLALGTGTQFLGIMLAIQVMNNFGRVYSEMCYFFLAAGFMLLYGGIISYGNSPATAICFLLTAHIFAFSGISVLWVHTVELFPTELRVSGHSSCCIVGRIGAFLAVFWVNDYADLTGDSFNGCLFYALSALTAGCLVFFLPETTGVKLDDIAYVSSTHQQEEEESLLDQSNTSRPFEKRSLLGNLRKSAPKIIR